MTVVLIIGIIVAIIWVLVILVQNPKGGGLASNFSQGNQLFGVEKTTDVVEKITWGGAILIAAICIFASFTTKSKLSKANREKQQNAAPKTEKTAPLPNIPKG